MRFRAKKLICLITLTSFIFTLGGIPPQAWANISLSTPGEVKTSHAFDLEIPPDLGTVETLISGTGPAVIHIQEAHGNAGVQKKIRDILHYLKSRYGVRLVLLEGSAFKLHPELARFFPEDVELTMEVLESLADKHLATGPELFLAKEKNASAYGIENLKAYVENGASFKAVLEQKEKSRNFLNDLNIQIERLTSPYLNQDLRRFLKNSEAFEEKRLGFEEWLNILKAKAKRNLEIDLTHPIAQIDWPMLVRIFKLKEFEEKLNQEVYPKEKTAFLAAIRRFVPQALDKEVKRLLSSSLSQSQLPDPETGLLFENMVVCLPRHFNYRAFPNVNLFIGHLILQSELRGEMLTAEVERLQDQIADKLAETENEKGIVKLLKDYQLLKRLFNLELTPQDYESIVGKEDRSDFPPEADPPLAQRPVPFSLEPSLRGSTPSNAEAISHSRPSSIIQHAVALNTDKRIRNKKFEHLTEIDNLFDKALEFYHGAKERDHWLIENVERRLKETGETRAVVITGGFHTGPFKEYFEKRGYNYALITPKMTADNPSGREVYIRSILDNYFTSSALSSTYAPVQQIIAPRSLTYRLTGNPWAFTKAIEAGIEQALELKNIPSAKRKFLLQQSRYFGQFAARKKLSTELSPAKSPHSEARLLGQPTGGELGTNGPVRAKAREVKTDQPKTLVSSLETLWVRLGMAMRTASSTLVSLISTFSSRSSTSASFWGIGATTSAIKSIFLSIASNSIPTWLGVKFSSFILKSFLSRDQSGSDLSGTAPKGINGYAFSGDQSRAKNLPPRLNQLLPSRRIQSWPTSFARFSLGQIKDAAKYSSTIPTMAASFMRIGRGEIQNVTSEAPKRISENRNNESAIFSRRSDFDIGGSLFEAKKNVNKIDIINDYSSYSLFPSPSRSEMRAMDSNDEEKGEAEKPANQDALLPVLQSYAKRSSVIIPKSAGGQIQLPAELDQTILHSAKASPADLVSSVMQQHGEALIKTEIWGNLDQLRSDLNDVAFGQPNDETIRAVRKIVATMRSGIEKSHVGLVVSDILMDRRLTAPAFMGITDELLRAQDPALAENLEGLLKENPEIQFRAFQWLFDRLIEEAEQSLTDKADTKKHVLTTSIILKQFNRLLSDTDQKNWLGLQIHMMMRFAGRIAEESRQHQKPFMSTLLAFYPKVSKDFLLAVDTNFAKVSSIREAEESVLKKYGGFENYAQAIETLLSFGVMAWPDDFYGYLKSRFPHGTPLMQAQYLNSLKYGLHQRDENGGVLADFHQDRLEFQLEHMVVLSDEQYPFIQSRLNQAMDFIANELIDYLLENNFYQKLSDAKRTFLIEFILRASTSGQITGGRKGVLPLVMFEIKHEKNLEIKAKIIFGDYFSNEFLATLEKENARALRTAILDGLQEFSHSDILNENLTRIMRFFGLAAITEAFEFYEQHITTRIEKAMDALHLAGQVASVYDVKGDAESRSAFEEIFKRVVSLAKDASDEKQEDIKDYYEMRNTVGKYYRELAGLEEQSATITATFRAVNSKVSGLDEEHRRLNDEKFDRRKKHDDITASIEEGYSSQSQIKKQMAQYSRLTRWFGWGAQTWVGDIVPFAQLQLQLEQTNESIKDSVAEEAKNSAWIGAIEKRLTKIKPERDKAIEEQTRVTEAYNAIATKQEELKKHVRKAEETTLPIQLTMVQDSKRKASGYHASLRLFLKSPSMTSDLARQTYEPLTSQEKIQEQDGHALITQLGILLDERFRVAADLEALKEKFAKYFSYQAERGLFKDEVYEEIQYLTARAKDNQLIPTSPEDVLYKTLQILLRNKRYQPDTTARLAQLANDERIAKRDQKEVTKKIVEEVIKIVSATDISLAPMEDFLRSKFGDEKFDGEPDADKVKILLSIFMAMIIHSDPKKGIENFFFMLSGEKGGFFIKPAEEEIKVPKNRAQMIEKRYREYYLALQKLKNFVYQNKQETYRLEEGFGWDRDANGAGLNYFSVLFNSGAVSEELRRNAEKALVYLALEPWTKEGKTEEEKKQLQKKKGQDERLAGKGDKPEEKLAIGEYALILAMSNYISGVSPIKGENAAEDSPSRIVGRHDAHIATKLSYSLAKKMIRSVNRIRVENLRIVLSSLEKIESALDPRIAFKDEDKVVNVQGLVKEAIAKLKERLEIEERKTPARHKRLPAQNSYALPGFDEIPAPKRIDEGFHPRSEVRQFVGRTDRGLGSSYHARAEAREASEIKEKLKQGERLRREEFIDRDDGADTILPISSLPRKKVFQQGFLVQLRSWSYSSFSSLSAGWMMSPNHKAEMKINTSTNLADSWRSLKKDVAKAEAARILTKSIIVFANKLLRALAKIISSISLAIRREYSNIFIIRQTIFNNKAYGFLPFVFLPRSDARLPGQPTGSELGTRDQTRAEMRMVQAETGWLGKYPGIQPPDEFAVKYAMPSPFFEEFLKTPHADESFSRLMLNGNKGRWEEWLDNRLAHAPKGELDDFRIHLMEHFLKAVDDYRDSRPWIQNEFWKKHKTIHENLENNGFYHSHQFVNLVRGFLVYYDAQQNKIVTRPWSMLYRNQAVQSFVSLLDAVLEDYSFRAFYLPQVTPSFWQRKLRSGIYEFGELLSQFLTTQMYKLLGIILVPIVLYLAAGIDFQRLFESVPILKNLFADSWQASYSGWEILGMGLAALGLVAAGLTLSRIGKRQEALAKEVESGYLEKRLIQRIVHVSDAQIKQRQEEFKTMFQEILWDLKKAAEPPAVKVSSPWWRAAWREAQHSFLEIISYLAAWINPPAWHRVLMELRRLYLQETKHDPSAWYLRAVNMVRDMMRERVDSSPQTAAMIFLRELEDASPHKNSLEVWARTTKLSQEAAELFQRIIRHVADQSMGRSHAIDLSAMQVAIAAVEAFGERPGEQPRESRKRALHDAVSVTHKHDVSKRVAREIDRQFFKRFLEKIRLSEDPPQTKRQAVTAVYVTGLTRLRIALGEWQKLRSRDQHMISEYVTRLLAAAQLGLYELLDELSQNPDPYGLTPALTADELNQWKQTLEKLIDDFSRKEFQNVIPPNAALLLPPGASKAHQKIGAIDRALAQEVPRNLHALSTALIADPPQDYRMILAQLNRRIQEVIAPVIRYEDVRLNALNGIANASEPAYRTSARLDATLFDRGRNKHTALQLIGYLDHSRDSVKILLGNVGYSENGNSYEAFKDPEKPVSLTLLDIKAVRDVFRNSGTAERALRGLHSAREEVKDLFRAAKGIPPSPQKPLERRLMEDHIQLPLAIRQFINDEFAILTTELRAHSPGDTVSENFLDKLEGRFGTVLDFNDTPYEYRIKKIGGLEGWTDDDVMRWRKAFVEQNLRQMAWVITLVGDPDFFAEFHEALDENRSLRLRAELQKLMRYALIGMNSVEKNPEPVTPDFYLHSAIQGRGRRLWEQVKQMIIDLGLYREYADLIAVGDDLANVEHVPLDLRGDGQTIAVEASALDALLTQQGLEKTTGYDMFSTMIPLGAIGIMARAEVRAADSHPVISAEINITRGNRTLQNSEGVDNVISVAPLENLSDEDLKLLNRAFQPVYKGGDYVVVSWMNHPIMLGYMSRLSEDELLPAYRQMLAYAKPQITKMEAEGKVFSSEILPGWYRYFEYRPFVTLQIDPALYQYVFSMVEGLLAHYYGEPIATFRRDGGSEPGALLNSTAVVLTVEPDWRWRLNLSYDPEKLAPEQPPRSEARRKDERSIRELDTNGPVRSDARLPGQPTGSQLGTRDQTRAEMRKNEVTKEELSKLNTSELDGEDPVQEVLRRLGRVGPFTPQVKDEITRAINFVKQGEFTKASNGIAQVIEIVNQPPHSIGSDSPFVINLGSIHSALESLAGKVVAPVAGEKGQPAPATLFSDEQTEQSELPSARSELRTFVSSESSTPRAELPSARSELRTFVSSESSTPRAELREPVKILLADVGKIDGILALEQKYPGQMILSPERGIGKDTKRLQSVIARDHPHVMVVRSGVDLKNAQTLEGLAALSQMPGSHFPPVILRSGSEVDIDAGAAQKLGIVVIRTHGSEESVPEVTEQFYMGFMRAVLGNAIEIRPASEGVDEILRPAMTYEPQIFIDAIAESEKAGRGHLTEEQVKALFPGFRIRNMDVVREFHGRMTIGLAGFGKIPHQLIKKFDLFSRVLGSEPRIMATSISLGRMDREAVDEAMALGITPSSKKEIIKQADVISIHLPTHAGAFIKREDLEIIANRAGPSSPAAIINTSRLASVDHQALLDKFRELKAAGKPLSIYYFADIDLTGKSKNSIEVLEKLRAEFPENVFLTNHIGAFTAPALAEVENRTVGVLDRLRIDYQAGKGLSNDYDFLVPPVRSEASSARSELRTFVSSKPFALRAELRAPTIEALNPLHPITTIVFAEDVEDLLEGYKRIFGLDRFPQVKQIRYFNDGRQALDFIRTLNEEERKGVLLVTDRDMPHLGGTMLIIQFRKLVEENIPIIVASAARFAENQLKSLGGNVADDGKLTPGHLVPLQALVERSRELLRSETGIVAAEYRKNILPTRLLFKFGKDIFRKWVQGVIPEAFAGNLTAGNNASGVRSLTDISLTMAQLVSAQKVFGVRQPYKDSRESEISKNSGDAFMIGGGFAVEDGALPVLREIFANKPFVVIAHRPGIREVVLKYNQEILIPNAKPAVLIADSVGEANQLLRRQILDRGGVTPEALTSLRGIIGTSDLGLAEALKRVVGDNFMTLTQNRFNHFAKSASLDHLVSSFKARFVISRAA